MLIERIMALAANPRPLTGDELKDVQTSFADTLAVTLAGWTERSATLLRKVQGHEFLNPLPADRPDLPAESLALHLGTAAHALDYDDVNLDSVTHPSAVVISALIAVTAHNRKLAERVPSAYAIGLTVDQALGRVLGFGHYDKGWHASSTIGPVAAVTALCHLLGLSERQARSALALAVTNSAGLQLNFGSMAKHLQIGQSAEGAVRAALLARSGFSGSEDVFASSGFFDLYKGTELVEQPEETNLDLTVATVSRKLYPCCYLTHRMISAALDLRNRCRKGVPSDASIEVLVPYGGLSALRIKNPKTGSEAKFCASYVIAVALLRGRVLLQDFKDEALHAPDIRELMSRIKTLEQPMPSEPLSGIGHGEVALTIRSPSGAIFRASCQHYPGSPTAPADKTALSNKIDDCLSVYCAKSGNTLNQNDLMRWLDPFFSQLRELIYPLH